MKITPAQADGFVRKPDPAVRAALVYGPDEGLARERAEALARSAVPDLADPFRVAELSGDTVAADPARLADEAAAIAFGGGRRVVRVRDCTDAALPAVEAALAAATGDTLIVLQAGDLGPRSALRQRFEAAKDAAAIACYADEGTSLERLIADTLGQEKISVEPEAMSYLAAHLGADRGVSRAELEKLAVFAGPGSRVSLADAMAVVGDSAAISLEDVVYAATDGDSAGLDRALERTLRTGTSPVAVLRAVAGHLLRLQLVAGRVAKGEPEARAIKSLRPPVFFRRENQFRRHLSVWRGARMERGLLLTLEAEALCKTTGTPDAAVCGRTLQQIAALARQGRGPG